MRFGGPWCLIRHYKRVSAIASIVVITMGWNIAFLNSRSVITIMDMALSGPEGSRPVIKSIEILAHCHSGIGSGFKSPHCCSRQKLVRPHTSQFHWNYRTSCNSPGHVKRRLIRAFVKSLPRWPVRDKSWVYWIILVQSGSWYGIHIRSLQQSHLWLLIEHSAINIGKPHFRGNWRSPHCTACLISQ